MVNAARVWIVDLDAPSDRLGEAREGSLDVDERHRAAALRDPATSRRYATAHAVLRLLLAEATGVRPRDVRLLRSPCTRCGADHGRPFVADGPDFNLSRSGRWAAIAIAQDARVGIDIEVRQAASRLEPLRTTLLAPGEHSDDLLRTWVRKEALAKASGQGLTRELSTIRADARPVHDVDLHPLLGQEVADHLVAAVAGVAEFTAETFGSTKVRQPMPAHSRPEGAE